MRRLIAMLAFCAALFCAFMFHQSYWRFRDVFDENGRYFDAEAGVVYFSQSGVGWATVGLFSLLIGVGLARRKRSIRL